MKGATTEPCVRTKRPPKIRNSTSSGISQNFFRDPRNSKSSAKIDIPGLLELLVQRSLTWAGRVARGPIGRGLRGKLQSEDVLARLAQKPADRDHGAVEQEAHDDGADNCVQREAELEP